MRSWLALSLLLLGGCRQRSAGTQAEPKDLPPSQEQQQAPRQEPEGTPHMTQRQDAPPPADSGTKASPGGPALAHPPSSQEAIDAFRRFWNTQLAASGHPAVARLSSLVKSTTPSATRRDFSEYRQLVLDRLGAESHPAILFGGLDLLQGEGQCWDVLFAGLLSGGVGGCVDARDGRILLVWETPEG